MDVDMPPKSTLHFCCLFLREYNRWFYNFLSFFVCLFNIKNAFCICQFLCMSKSIDHLNVLTVKKIDIKIICIYFNFMYLFIKVFHLFKLSGDFL